MEILAIPETGGHRGSAAVTDDQFFFVHVMKTAGGTFRQHIYDNFPPGAVYPDRRIVGSTAQMNREYTDIQSMLDLTGEQRERTRVFGGHFPFCTVDMLGLRLLTLTILRDPVDRTISYLRRRQSRREPDRRPEEIYEDPMLFPMFIHNHQVKLFALTAADRPESYLDLLEIDDARLEVAKENLERVDLLGLTREFERFLQAVRDRYGWRIGGVQSRHVADGGGWEPSAAFRRRVASDNAADVEFYRLAEQLYRRRERG